MIYKTVVCWLNGLTFWILNISEYQVFIRHKRTEINCCVSHLFALSFHRLVKICLTANQCNLSFILIMVSIQLRAQDASLQIHVIQGFFPIQSSLPLSVFDDPFLAAFHGLNHEREIKNSTKPKTRPPPPPPPPLPPKQMRKINANRQVCSPSKRDLRATFDCIWQSNTR